MQTLTEYWQVKFVSKYSAPIRCFVVYAYSGKQVMAAVFVRQLRDSSIVIDCPVDPETVQEQDAFVATVTRARFVVPMTFAYARARYGGTAWRSLQSPSGANFCLLETCAKNASNDDNHGKMCTLVCRPLRAFL